MAYKLLNNCWDCRFKHFWCAFYSYFKNCQQLYTLCVEV